MPVVAFRMKLRPGCQAEYQRRHAEIWPELLTLLHDSGISDYRIFLDESTDMLFASQTISGESSQALGQTEIVKRWWAYMADLMDTNDDNSPVSVPLREVFYMP
ncbi:L-rhamnose mutarotase [Spirosoma rhododendri]|uniref:L-rhamnose mutarotase n=1 Tax=Spirosoma rhododendri TaxID=2728024 RepID=A0A7L5DWC8_9BACT|nr:L-rhamnose mutarotase [Spirosoma rhododendri]QJD80928.1 L-rhamnose mutarotase [Spirosoma rhododendri]